MASEGRAKRLMDAGMGTALLARGVDPLLAVLAHPEHVADIHAGHVAAGAEAVLTATFQANPVTVGERLPELGRTGVRLARACGAKIVLGSIGPTHSPGLSGEFADREALARTLEALAGVDAYLLETCSSPAALAAAAFAARRVGPVKVWLSLTYHRVEGRLVTFSGHGPEEYARQAERHGVAALGVNCGKDISPSDVAAIVRVYRENTGLPLFARPNAGSPGGASHGPEAFAAAGIEADWVGGCCGTTAEHLRGLVEWRERRET